MELKTNIHDETLRTFIDLCKKNNLTPQEVRNTACLFSPLYQNKLFQTLQSDDTSINATINKVKDFQLANMYTLKFSPAGDKLACGTNGYIEYVIELNTNTTTYSPGLIFFDETTSFTYLKREHLAERATVLKFPDKMLAIESKSWISVHSFGVNIKRNELYLFYALNFVEIYDLLNNKIKKTIYTTNADEFKQHLKIQDIFAIRSNVFEYIRVFSSSAGCLYCDKSSIDAFAFHPTDEVIYLAKKNVIEVVDFEQKKVLEKFEIPNFEGPICSLTSNGSLLCIVTPKKIQIWNMLGDKKLHSTLTSDTSIFTHASFSPVGKLLAIADTEKVSLYSLDT